MEEDCGDCGGVVFDGRVNCEFTRIDQAQEGI
jgi:hypothetical protein